jgi:predicted GNAT family acetyltransferase
MTPFGTHLKMDFHGLPSDLTFSNAHDCIQLTHGDEPQLRILYQFAYPGNYFDPQMLTTGKYFGVKKGEEILSVAGVHVYSRTYQIAVLGNVTTHPYMRNRGLAKRCVVTLLKTLEPEVDFIGLNVKADNYPAIALYHAIGFEIASTYEEALFERH